eukprot:TRINITY_DN9765_c0_g1_i1.p1 TRINITY_DN9765_c0_g1~~TRINITY_DN9765_c0_g1_i1.p1  ORF type:complete len:155 (-),score=12.39 TRINITY_DN9765_c0_g1_i1:1-465(-)
MGVKECFSSFKEIISDCRSAWNRSWKVIFSDLYVQSTEMIRLWEIANHKSKNLSDEELFQWKKLLSKQLFPDREFPSSKPDVAERMKEVHSAIVDKGIPDRCINPELVRYHQINPSSISNQHYYSVLVKNVIEGHNCSHKTIQTEYLKIRYNVN